MSKDLDARGLSCPQPVLLVRKAMADGDFPVHVLVETVTSRENIRRLAEKAGLRVSVDEEGEDYRMTIDK